MKAPESHRSQFLNQTMIGIHGPSQGWATPTSRCRRVRPKLEPSCLSCIHTQARASNESLLAPHSSFQSSFELSDSSGEVALAAPGPGVGNPVPKTPATVWALIALQGVALVGALVGGLLARGRRLELQGLNLKLRQINSELRKRSAAEGDPVCAVGEDEALATYRHALESALGQAAAAHPYETFGAENLSLAQARRRLALRIREGRSALYEQDGTLALQKANESEGMADDLKDLRASRAVTRLKATALRQVGEMQSALEQLEMALKYSDQLEDHSHDADVLGEIADTYADLGDFEKAAKAYDRCIDAMQEETASPQLSSWDC